MKFHLHTWHKKHLPGSTIDVPDHVVDQWTAGGMGHVVSESPVEPSDSLSEAVRDSETVKASEDAQTPTE